MYFLEAKNIVKRYAHHLALDDVSISVPKGAVFGLMGPNGAGKTTLIRIINRITAPDSGQVFFDGKPFSKSDIARIGYLPEERGLYKKMKVGEQAVYLARLKGLDKKTAVKRLTEWFEKFEIMPWWNKKVEELSKGMQQKIQFVCTVIHEPDLLIFDEPFSGFDPVNAELLKNEILSLREKGSTIIFSTHNMQSIEEVCDEFALFKQSKIILSGNVREVREQFSTNILTIKISSSSPIEGRNFEGLNIIDQDSSYGELTLRIARNKEESNRAILNKIPEDLKITSFYEEIPSMNDIFIQTVTQQEQ